MMPMPNRFESLGYGVDTAWTPSMVFLIMADGQITKTH